MRKFPHHAVAANVRRARHESQLTLDELSRRAGVSRTTLFHIESGDANPSLDTIWSVATALAVPFSALIDEESSSPRLIRSTEGEPVINDDDTYAATLLASARASTRSDVYRVDVVEGADRRCPPHVTGTIEHLIVVHGTVEAGVLGARETLRAGDCLSYSADQEHYFAAIGGAAQAVLILEARAN